MTLTDQIVAPLIERFKQWNNRWALRTDHLCCLNCHACQGAADSKLPFQHDDRCQSAYAETDYPWNDLMTTLREELASHRQKLN